MITVTVVRPAGTSSPSSPPKTEGIRTPRATIPLLIPRLLFFILLLLLLLSFVLSAFASDTVLQCRVREKEACARP